MSPQRLLKEYREAKSAKLDPEITLNLTDETDIFLWTAHLKGPEGTPYDGGTFVISLRCPASYPLAPPKCTFATPVFHPCVRPSVRSIILNFLLGLPTHCALLELAGQKRALQDGRDLP
jgi:ubiquitin-protein ligase